MQAVSLTGEDEACFLLSAAAIKWKDRQEQSSKSKTSQGSPSTVFGLSRQRLFPFTTIDRWADVIDTAILTAPIPPLNHQQINHHPQLSPDAPSSAMTVYSFYIFDRHGKLEPEAVEST